MLVCVDAEESDYTEHVVVDRANIVRDCTRPELADLLMQDFDAIYGDIVEVEATDIKCGAAQSLARLVGAARGCWRALEEELDAIKAGRKKRWDTVPADNDSANDNRCSMPAPIDWLVYLRGAWEASFVRDT